MGNENSTRWAWGYQRKATTADCIVIDAKDTLPDVVIIEAEYAGWGFSDGDLSFEMWYGDSPRAELVVYQRTTPNYIRLERTESSPSGSPIDRYWFLCPSCQRRCRVLYIPPQSHEIACRMCHDLAYRSQQETH